MSSLITNRRSLITGLISLVAAPAIVRASSLMPVKALKPDYRGAAFRFMMNDLYSGVPVTGAKVSGYVAQAGRPYELLTAPLYEIGEGVYEAVLLSNEIGEKIIQLRFTAEKAQDANIFWWRP